MNTFVLLLKTKELLSPVT